jgi:hypothetical protein
VEVSKDETITVSSTGGQKAGNLERHDLIPPRALSELAEHFGRGAAKYSARQWELGYEWGKSYAALQRHIQAFWGGEDYDEQTGSKHVVAAMWHCVVLATFMDRFPEFDDRPTTVGPAVTVDPDDCLGITYRTWMAKLNSEPLIHRDCSEFRPGGLIGNAVPREEFNTLKTWTPYAPTTLTFLSPGTEGEWQAAVSSLIYRFVDGAWWWRNPYDDSEDPWRESQFRGGELRENYGPFTRYHDVESA